MHYWPLDRLLHGGISAMIVFATIMLGIGEQSVVLTLVTLVAVTVSTYVTDIRKSFQLSQGVADSVALGIVIVSAANTLYVDRAGQIWVVASLQSYLQYVLLFQPKTPRIYWQLALLSLGQVAIAATLIAGIIFGTMLFVYVLLGVFTFSLLLIRTEAARCEPARAMLPVGTASRSNTKQHWPRSTTLSGGTAPIPRGFERGLIRLVAAVMLVTLVVASTSFFFIPRWKTEDANVPTTEPLRTVGFSRTITLGELGDVVQNPDIVMRISFFRGLSTQPLRLANEPLFRGSVVSRYRDGEWTESSHSRATPFLLERGAPYVRQQITVEPLDVRELFCVVPVFEPQGFHHDQRLRIDPGGEQLYRQEDFRSHKLEFQVATTGIVGDRQRMFLPCRWSLHRSGRMEMTGIPRGRDGQDDPFTGLRETVGRVLRERGVDPNDHYATALALHDYLRHSGEFTYSLEGQVRGANVDPLEDFVTLHRKGHCEYFAGALVMMLRSQGIPARMAIGFKGGEWNAPGMYYQVQQLHAHAWVEAYLEGDDIPPEAFAGDDVQPPAAWMVLDPTVSTTDSENADQRIGLFTRLRQYIDYSQVLWANYVVGLSARRQQESIYAPLIAGVRAGVHNLVGPDVWQGRLEAVTGSPVGRFWRWYRRHWFDWRGGLVAAGASLLLVGCYFGLRRVRRPLRRLLHWKRQHEAPVLEMYRRLEAALARRGFHRRAGQTAREFAVTAGGHLAESIELNGVSHLPRRIVESYYRVRFGRRTLDNREAEAVEHALRELELALARRRR